jgi:TolA-binding protein
MQFSKHIGLLQKLILVLFPIILLSGCGIWEDFTTYFNLYYNTTDIFQEAEKTIKEQKRELFSSEELIIPGSVNTQLTKVIEKSSKILQFASESSYVDDALLILGKAFYYQKNYQKALRKFQELIATQPESDLILETELWIAKTQMKLKEYNTALTQFESVRKKAVEEGEEEIIKEAYVEEIIYRNKIEEYQTSIALCSELLEVSGNDEVNAEVVFELGKLYKKVNEPANAAAAFERIFDYSPSYETELGARLELGKSLREGGNYTEALERFEEMRDEDKFSDAYGEIDLEIGITLINLDRLEEALDKLKYVDTAFVNTEYSGVAKYKLGEVYENNYMNFDSASIYYQKAAASVAPEEYRKMSAEKNDLFKKYESLRTQINGNRKQIFYIENPDEFVKDSIAYVQDSLAFIRDSLQIMEEMELISEHLQSLAGLDTLSHKPLFDSTAVKDSLLKASLNLDSLKLDSLRLDSLKADSIKKSMFLKPNDKTTGVSRDSLILAGMKGRETKFKRPIRPTLPIDSLQTRLVKNELEFGNTFLTEFNIPDSAYYYYLDILTNYPNTQYKANVLYALGSYYLTINEKQKADSLFNYIYDNYKDQSIVNAAANKLNKPLIDLEYDPAKEMYAEGESLLDYKNYTASINKFYDIYKSYPESPLAPKALYATGWILENELDLLDSAAVIYDSISTNYPKSEYAALIMSKLSVYKQHKKAAEDSAGHHERLKLDSLAVKDSVEIDQELIDFTDEKIIDSKSTADSLKQHHTAVDSLLRDRRKGIEFDRDFKPPVDSLTSKKTERRNPRKK